MINFELLVQNSLHQYNKRSNRFIIEAGKDQEEEEAKSVIEYLTVKGKNKYDEFNEILKQKFPSLYFPPQDAQLNQICYNVISASTRSVKDLTPFSGIQTYFPLLDLIATLHEKCFKKGGAENKKNVADVADNVIKNLNNQIKSLIYPLDYVPLNGWVGSLKNALLASSRTEVGKLRMEGLSEKSSFFQMILHLLTIRKKILMPKLPAAIMGINGSPIINTIFKEPWKVISGKYPINDEKMRLIYDDTTVSELVSLTLSAYALYRQQINEAFVIYKTLKLSEDNETDFKTIETKLLNDPKAYSLFIGTDKESSTVDWNLILEPLIGTTTKSKETESNFKVSEFHANKNLTEDNALVFLYNKVNLTKAANSGNEQAKTFLAQLNDLANYIKTKTSRDLLGGATQLAKGLQFGTKQMGS